MDSLPGDARPFIQRVRYQLDNFLNEIPPAKHLRDAGKASRELVERCVSIDVARNRAIDWLQERGVNFGPHSRPVPGKMYARHSGRQIGVGMESTAGPYWRIRIDFDPQKGPHYNVEYKFTGEKVAFTFPSPAGVDPESWMRKLMESIGDAAKRPLR